MPEPASDTPRISRLLRLIQELQTKPRQAPEALRGRLGVGRSTLFEDMKALAAAGYAFHYDRRRQCYVRAGDGAPPLLDLTVTEVLALVMAVQQFSSSGDHILLYDAVEGIKKLLAATPAPTRALLEGALDDILRETFRSTPA